MAADGYQKKKKKILHNRGTNNVLWNKTSRNSPDETIVQALRKN